MLQHYQNILHFAEKNLDIKTSIDKQRNRETDFFIEKSGFITFVRIGHQNHRRILAKQRP